MIDLNGKTVMVTGGAGFIGSNFIDLICTMFNDMRIYNVDKMGVGSRNILNPHGKVLAYDFGQINGNSYFFHLKDLTNWKDVEFFSKIKFDYIFHFAAESHVDRSINLPVSFIHNNVISTANLMEFTRLYQPSARVIHVSTDEVYGHLEYGDEPFVETTPLNPRSPYSASKASSDLVALSYNRTFGLDVIITRCCNNYGPFQHHEKFIPTILNSLKNGTKIPLYGNGFNIREWIYVDDHNKSILEITEKGEAGSVYNIGSGVEKDNTQMIIAILDNLYGTGDRFLDYVQYVEDRKGHDFRYAIKSLNYSRGFELTPFDTGLKRTIKHYIRSTK